MLFQKIDFHNVEEMVKTEKGYCMSRFPQHVREKLNPGVRELSAFYCTGVELRFKLRSEKAVITLRSAVCAEAQVAYIYYGSIQGGWENSSRVILTEDTPITVTRPENMEQLKEITARHNLPFSPEVIRIVLPYNKCYFLGIEGDIETPSDSEMPQKTYLAYGSSITHGSLALAAPYSYPFQIAQRLGCDYLNKGVAGSAQLEKPMAEYLVSRKDWTFASLELGINMIKDEFTTELFEARVKEFLDVMKNDDRKIFVTSVFGYNEVAQEKAVQYRKVVKKYASERFVYTDGLELLNYPPYISQDLVHPSTEGIAEIVSKWLFVMNEYLS